MKPITSTSRRDRSIDFMRFVGIALIVLAHIRDIDPLLFEFRAFDVPLMIFVSGLCFSGKTISGGVPKFLLHRTPRLIVPLYLFLTIYFALLLVAGEMGVNTGLTRDHIIGSYLLSEGIGYVWVIRVFLLIMLLTPAMLWIYRKVSRLTFICLALLLVQTLLVKYVVSASDAPLMFIFREYVLYGLGYAVIFLCGLQAGTPARSPRPAYVWYALLAGYCVYFYISEGSLALPINNNKYPPAGIYIIYGVAMSFLLNTARPLLARFSNRFTDFVGSSTMWIYLYHIPFCSVFIKVSSFAALPWGVRYAMIFFFAASLTYLQALASRKAEMKWPSGFWKYLRG